MSSTRSGEAAATHSWTDVGLGPGIGPSRLALGTSALGTFEAAAPVYDAFAEAGGRMFDTAWIYGEQFGLGCCERALGEWLTARNCANDMFILAKGGHPPRCRPELLAQDLEESLDRLGVGFVATYMPHRDDVSIPVDEFVDALAELVAAGVTQSYGLSNWSPARYAEAAAYAARRSIPGPVAISNNFSLAEMVHPVYPGIWSTGETERQWLTTTGTPLVAWSSQARGLFARAAQPSDVHADEFAKHWSSSANEARLARALELAAARAFTAVNVALAWVLHQPFPAVPVIGPRSPDEVASCVRGLEIELSTGDVEWLWAGEPATGNAVVA